VLAGRGAFILFFVTEVVSGARLARALVARASRLVGNGRFALGEGRSGATVRIDTGGLRYVGQVFFAVCAWDPKAGFTEDPKSMIDPARRTQAYLTAGVGP